MKAMRTVAVLLLASIAIASDADEQEATPIRRALIMLNGMSQQVDKHLKEEDVLFDKQMCFCKSKGLELQQSIAEAKEKLPQLTSSVQEAQSTVRQLEGDIKEHTSSRDAALKAVQEQAALRKAEAKAFAKASAESQANIGNIQKAVAALRKGGKSALLQGDRLDRVRSFAQTVNADRLRDEDREKLASLLEQMEQAEEGGEAATTDVGEIVGVLSQMLDNMKADLKQMTKQEEDSIAQAGALNKAKQKELQTLGATIQDKQARLSNTRVEMVQLKKELESTSSGLDTDGKLQKNLGGECEQRKKEHATVKTDLMEEQKAITEAANILSSDQAMNTFQKATVTARPGAAASSFLQLGMSDNGGDDDDAQAAAAQVSDMLKKLSASRAGADSFSFLASQAARAAASTAASAKRGGKPVPSGLTKIKKLVDSMTELLRKEQEDDDLKKQMCSFEVKQQSANLKTLGEAMDARAADLANVKNQHEVVRKDMQTLKAGIEALDKSVAEETKQRKEAHAALVKRLAENHAAMELLHTAKKRLQKVYKSFIQQPLAVVQEQQQQQPSGDEFGFDDVVEEQGITVHHEQGSLAQTTADRPKLMNDGTKVINLLSKIQADIDRENANMKSNDKKDQASYEQMTAASAAKREADSKALSKRAATAAELAESTETLTKKHKALRGELEQTKTVLANLHKECDWLVQHYDKRKKLRSAEAEALKRTQAVLAGANLGLTQIEKARVLRHG